MSLLKLRPLCTRIGQTFRNSVIIERPFSKVLVRNPLRQQVLTPIYLSVQTTRWKGKKGSKSKQKTVDVEEESDVDTYEFDDLVVDKQTKIKELKIDSLRADGLLKTGFVIARNKVDAAFFESKIRVNGKKVLKKGECVKEGDEVDMVRGFSITNPKLLSVARLEILSVIPRTDHFIVKVRACKGLVIENYEDPWISPAASTLGALAT